MLLTHYNSQIADNCSTRRPELQSGNNTNPQLSGYIHKSHIIKSLSNSPAYPHAADILEIFLITSGNWYIVNNVYNLIKVGLANSLAVKFILIFTSTMEFIRRKE